MFYELNHMGVFVRDLDRSLDFYRDVLGAQVVFHDVVESTNLGIVYLQIGDSLIELLHPADPGPGDRFGLAHIAFLTDDLDGDYARITAAGYDGLSAPKIAGTGIGRLAFIRGPDGARVELIQRDLALRGARAEHPVVASFDHFGLATGDRAAALDFYRDLLGMHELSASEPDAAAPPGAGPDRLSFGSDILELRSEPGTTEVSVLSHIAVGVRDVDAALRSFDGHGFDAHATGARATGVRATEPTLAISDPDGVRIELIPVPSAPSPG